MDAFIFPKAHRLRKRWEFLKLASQGKRLHNAYFIIVYHYNPGGTSRLGVTVTRKVGGACVRNRLKRLAREYFRTHRHRLNRPYDINIIAKKSAAQLENKELTAALASLLGRMP